MRTQSDDLLWVFVTVIGGVLLVTAGALLVVCRHELPDEVYLAFLPAVVFAAPLVLALVAQRESDPDHPSAGVLDRLVALRRADGLPPARRVSRRGPGRWPGRGAGGPPAPAPLDRLVRRKREWAGPPEDRSAGPA